MAVLQGVFQDSDGLAHADVDVRLYPASAFDTLPPPAGTDLPADDPLDTTTTGIHHGYAGAWSFSDVGVGSYVVALTFDAYTIFSLHQVGMSDVTGFGATGDGTTDDTTAIQAAIDSLRATGGDVLIPPGRYAVSQLVLPPSIPINLIGQGGATLVSLNTATGSGSALVCVSGAYTSTTTTLTSDALSGAHSIAVTASTNFTTGDWVIVRDTNYKYGTSGRNQEILRVLAKDASNLYFTNRLIGTYRTASTADVVKILPAYRNRIRDITFEIPAGKTGGAVYGLLGVEVAIEDCLCTGHNGQSAFEFKLCTHSQWVRSQVREQRNPVAAFYGFVGNDCTFCSGLDLETERVYANGWRDNSRYCLYDRSTARSPHLVGFTCDGTGNEFITFDNCMVENSNNYGFIIGGPASDLVDTNITLRNCKAFNCPVMGLFATAPGVTMGNDFRLLNSEFINCGGVFVNGAQVNISRYNRVTATNNLLDGKANTIAVYGFQLDALTEALFSDNIIRNLQATSRGIAFSSCTTVLFDHNLIANVNGNNFHNGGTNSKIRLYFNETDDNTNSLDGTETLFGNSFSGTNILLDKLAIRQTTATSSFAVSGSVAWTVAIDTAANATSGIITSGDYRTVIFRDASPGGEGFDRVLPDAALMTGRILRFKREAGTGNNPALIRTMLGQKIDNSYVAIRLDSNGAACELESHGTGWSLYELGGTITKIT